MPAVVAMRSTPRSAHEAPSASSSSVARSTSAWTAARLGVAVVGTAATVELDRVSSARLTAAMANNLLDGPVLRMGGTCGGRLGRGRHDLNDPFIELFDVHLVDACDRLMADRSGREAKVDFVTTYHMIIEGTLALTGQYFLTDYMTK